MARKTPLAELPSQPDPRAPFAAATFLRAARPVLAALTADLLTRADASPATRAALERHHRADVAASRTADDYAGWRRRVVVQVATAWLLSCVFVRVLEDRGLVGARIAGPGAHDSEAAFFRFAPSLGEREYLYTVFRELTYLPAAAPLFDAAHNLVWRIGPSAGACKALLQLLRAPHVDAPAFRFGQPDTRFLGDLYQHLDDGVREQYALLQTPDFIERFILDRTLEPAVAEYGVDHADVIDPTCGSGHFLLGAFDRLYHLLRRAKPGLHARDLAREALGRVHGVDINPYAVSIARFRLTLQFLEVGEYQHLLGAPAPPLHVIVADSLYYGFAGGQGDLGELPARTPEDAAAWHGTNFTLEDPDEARRILVEKTYAAVVGNPPYITVKDPVLREVYRREYDAAAAKYALSAPFVERFFQLAKSGGGYIGQITSNSFTKREFGAALIQNVLPRYDLELIVNTAGAYIPGHSTPTLLIFGRNRPPSREHVHAVLAKRGEPGIPSFPADGEVWRSICDHWHVLGFENEYISIEHVPLATLRVHPWTLDGGGAQELKKRLEGSTKVVLSVASQSIGITSFTLEDDVYIRPSAAWIRSPTPTTNLLPIIVGESIRDWSIEAVEKVFFPYDKAYNLIHFDPSSPELRALWPWRTNLSNNVVFGGKTKTESGMLWYEYGRLTANKLRSGVLIAFAEVATHNHFVTQGEIAVYKQTAPVINLSKHTPKEHRLGLLSYINSSTACFWMKQVAYPKSAPSETRAEHGNPEDNRYAFSATAIGKLPIPEHVALSTLQTFSTTLEQLQNQRDARSPQAVLLAALERSEDLPPAILRAEREDTALLGRMVAVQEDLDWAVYQLFRLAPSETAARWSPDLELSPSQRPFNHPDPPSHLGPADRALYLARVRAIAESKQLRLIENSVNKRPWKVRRGGFAYKIKNFAERVADAAAERITELAERVLRARCERAFAAVFTARDLERDLLADPHYQALRDHLVTVDPRLDPLRDRLTRESVPYLAGHRHSPSGLERHARWREVWALQRIADVSEARLPGLRAALEAATVAAREASEALRAARAQHGDPELALGDGPAPRARKPALVGPAPSDAAPQPPALLAAEAREAAARAAMIEASLDLEWAENHHRKARKLIPVPGKYEPADFRDPNYFRLRGKLDVPREAFISYPGAASDLDAQPVHGWAGWNHLQRAMALLQLYYHRKLEERWAPERLVPLLAGLEELLPWVRQWHADERHPDTGEHYADALEAHVQAGCAELGVTRPQLLAWTPGDGRPARPSLRNRRVGVADDPAAPRRAVEGDPAGSLTNRRRGPAPPTPAASTPPAAPHDPAPARPPRTRARRSATR